MGQQLACCAVRDGRAGCLDVNNSLLGEDAFYRDAFFDCEEGDQSHDWLFASALEQTRLKYRKASIVKQYAGFVLARSVAQWLFPSQFKPTGRLEVKDLSTPASPSSSGRSKSRRVSWSADWLGKTLPEWTRSGLPGASEGAFWKKGDGAGLRVRAGPNYVKTGLKTDSDGSLYEGVYCDAVKADTKITDIMGNIVQLSSLPKKDLHWKKESGVPRVLCINLMLPYETGVFSRKDGGCSFIGIFQVKQKTLEAIRTSAMPASLRLWQAFCAGPSGLPGEPRHPDRSLAQRVRRGVKKDRHSDLFKCMAHCVNPEDVKVPDMFHTYNGKPCIITKSGYIIKDPEGEWIEIGIDVRGFNILARNMLCRFRGLLPRTKIHYGFLVQGVEDDEMPEGLLCDMYVCGIDMLSSPLPIKNTDT